MPCSSALVLLACLVSTVPGGPPLAATSVAEEVVVRVYDAARLGATVSGRVMAMAEGILRTAFFQVRWMPCTRDAAVRAACRVPLGRDRARELVMRVVPMAPRATADDGRLGDAMVAPSGPTGVLGTVYVDRVTALAVAAGTDRVVLLGRALAHEIGHLMLGSGNHAPDGLMRAVWTAGEVRRDRLADWRFAESDVRRMHQARGAV
jgi:hypothetical protein